MHTLILFAIQHILVMVATPISSVFLIASALSLPDDLASALLSSVFVFSGLGSILQSVGIWKVGVRLPFVMLPGGAATILFISIAHGTDLQTAAGAVILTGIFYILTVTVFVRVLKYFPPLVIGTMVVVIGINLVKVTGQLVTGRPGTPHFGDPMGLLLALVTLVLTVLCFRFLRGFCRQLSVALGLIGGTIFAMLLGQTSFSAHLAGPAFSAPAFLPFGLPHLDLIAAIPMLVWSLASMAEATGQTVINGEIVGREVVATRDVPRVIRSDGIISIIGGFFGTPAMVTSGENIGIVRASGVRSRYVTAFAGILLILIGFTPLARILNGIPAAVVGGTAVVVFAIISVLGIQMLARVDFTKTGNLVTCTLALALGLLPVLIPGMYHRLPENLSAIIGSGVAMSALVAVLLNLLFHHTGRGDDSGSQEDKKPRVEARPANYRI
ncbi:MAG TPA: solute carrier family 23 protein [Castellaniella sp.]|uniref:uracil-xanthine permease family protein n=1 Tax=Castellaniella sp. TaxID=1955812 RepID=UPI002EF2F8D9